MEAGDATQILAAWNDGDKDAPARLIPIIYQELQRRASEYLRHERPDHTLQATALVHDAYLQLIAQSGATWKSRAHFCSVAAQIMRRILTLHARTHNAAKRGGQLQKVYLDETRELAHESTPDLIAVDDALENFAITFPRESKVVEMKFFGGMETREIAEALGVSEKTVLRDWIFARAWLGRQLTQRVAHV